MSGTIPANGSITFTNIQDVFGGIKPISLSEYYNNSSTGYTNGISGIPNNTTMIKLSNFYGKSKSILKSITLTTGTFNAPGAPGAWVSYNSPSITIPSDYRTLVSWDLTFYAYKNSSSFGFAYPGMGINNIGGTGIDGSSANAQSITRSWNNQTLQLGNANSSITCYVSFFTYANLSNCYFTLTIRYYT
jgi:hypothetical protein